MRDSSAGVLRHRVMQNLKIQDARSTFAAKTSDPRTSQELRTVTEFDSTCSRVIHDQHPQTVVSDARFMENTVYDRGYNGNQHYSEQNSTLNVVDVTPLGDLSAGTNSHLVSGTTGIISNPNFVMNSSTLAAVSLLSSQDHVARHHVPPRMLESSNMDVGTHVDTVRAGPALEQARIMLWAYFHLEINQPEPTHTWYPTLRVFSRTPMLRYILLILLLVLRLSSCRMW